MLIYLLLIILLLVWELIYFLGEKDILSAPSVLCLVFIISTTNAIINKDIWNFNMGERTFLVILIGIISFCIGYFVIYYCLKSLKKPKTITRIENKIVEIKNIKLALFVVIEIIGMILVYTYINSLGYSGSFSEKIYMYRVNAFLEGETDDKIPSYIQFVIDFCSMASIILIFKCCTDYFVKKIINIKVIFVILLAAILSMMTGGRGFTVILLISTFVMCYVFYMRKHSWKFNLTIKKLLCMVGVPSILLILFSSIGILLVGRTNEFENNISMLDNVWRLLSIYIGAPLKLLDLYLYTDYSDVGSKYPLIGYETFGGMYHWILPKLGITSLNMPLIGAGFRTDNLFMLGNVYTMFRYYMADFGFLGVGCLSGIMGCVFAYVFFRVKYIYHTNKKNIEYTLIFYSYIFISVALSFFSDWFYNWLLTVIIIKTIVYWKLFEFLFVEKSC